MLRASLSTALALAAIACRGPGVSHSAAPVAGPAVGLMPPGSGGLGEHAKPFCVHATSDGGDECSPHSGDQTGIGLLHYPDKVLLALEFVLRCPDCDPNGENHQLDPTDPGLLALQRLDDPSVAYEPGVSTHFLCLDLDCPEEFSGSSMTVRIDYEDGSHECQFFDGTWSMCAR